jgi:branched-chain amino acid transport system permease protein
MSEFFHMYGFLFVAMTQQSLLAMSLYYPLTAGQLSLATPGFYALGGYIAAIMGTNEFFTPLRDSMGWTIFPLECFVAAVASAILAVVIGIPALRLRGIYLALATIAFVEIIRVLVLNLTITGGAVGIFGIPQIFENCFDYFWIFGPLLIIMLIFSYRWAGSRVGRAFSALREDELAASSMGINPTYYKVLSFVIGAVLAGLVGAMSAPFINTWNARQGTFDAAIACLAYVLVGGSRSIYGPMMGAMLLTALPEILRPLQDSRLIINGLVLVVASVYLPQGIAGAITDAKLRLRGNSNTIRGVE